ncbi:OmpA family protein [Nocardiopsis sp. Huas11]|uniref:OmpA family protein n=1 Tax=Nocardiopsis sp. Huas11 TaxID=2183912 RepID=UPI000F1B1831|nr:OmpA family protein [Nocardiopsis sp. Huas11]RKS10319.1 OmpA family protein [Nocardiopsis sp. Huas11]
MRIKQHTPQAIKRGRIISASIAASVIPLFASSCVVAPDESPQTDTGEESPSNTEPSPPSPSAPEDPGEIATAITTSTEVGHELQIDITALERIQDDILRLSLKITNNSNERFRLSDGLSEAGEYYTAGGITLIDAQSQQRYLSYDLTDGTCLCGELDGAIDAGGSQDIWVAFPAPPSDLDSMTITTPLTPPIMDVPISTSNDHLNASNLAEPQILDLTMISDDLEDNTGRTESDGEVSIILSSDVLFETNSAELSPDSQEILEQVASEIDDASGTTISVDGHADNTGNESINVPLSLDRAEAVESTLSELTTRTGITFDVNGHGSSDPIANNDTEEGKERNRRVSITFEK